MNLSKKEFMLCVDSTNGLALYTEEYNPANYTIKGQIYPNLQDSIMLDRLDEKWEINKEEFLKKMREASEEEYIELWKRIEDFWAKRDKEGVEDNESKL